MQTMSIAAPRVASTAASRSLAVGSAIGMFGVYTQHGAGCDHRLTCVPAASVPHIAKDRQRP
jgi:hypothetical protein